MVDAFTLNDEFHLRVELIDPSTRRLIKSWKFAPQEEITLGRAPERDIEVADPYVSRHHASLSLRDREWYLVAYGRNGVLVSGNLVQEHPASDGLEFRLGALGPEFRFLIVPGADCSEDESTVGTETFHFSADQVPDFIAAVEAADFKLDIDQTRLAQEVSDIAETDYFQKLQGLSKQLREQRRTSRQ